LDSSAVFQDKCGVFEVEGDGLEMTQDVLADKAIGVQELEGPDNYILRNEQCRSLRSDSPRTNPTGSREASTLPFAMLIVILESVSRVGTTLKVNVVRAAPVSISIVARIPFTRP
jgi:hypothetical protein